MIKRIKAALRRFIVRAVLEDVREGGAVRDQIMEIARNA